MDTVIDKKELEESNANLKRFVGLLVAGQQDFERNLQSLAGMCQASAQKSKLNWKILKKQRANLNQNTSGEALQRLRLAEKLNVRFGR